MLRNFTRCAVYGLVAVNLVACAFMPRHVDLNAIEKRVVYPRESYSSRHQIAFGPFVDRRANTGKLGVARNKLMMVTTWVSMSGDLGRLLEQMVKQNFAAQGIGEGTSPLRLKGALLEARTDAMGPDHIFVQVTASLTLVNTSENTPVFHRTLKGYEVTPVTQVSNSAWEDALIGALNQISEQIDVAALETEKALKSGMVPGTQKVGVSTGSCVIVHPEGLILTVHHVVGGSDELMVRIADGRKFKAAILQSDPANDLVLLNVSESGLSYLSLAPARSAQAGQYVFTFGFPAISVLGPEPKFTEGSISALSGPAGIASLLQMSVPVQPGNSGGPLVSEGGELIGIVTSTASVRHFVKETGALPQNVNWAVKADYARPLFELPTPLPPARDREEAIARARSASCFIEATAKGS